MYLILKALSVLTLAEAIALVALFFDTPIQKWILVALGAFKRGRGPLVVKAVCLSLIAVFLYSFCSSFLIIHRYGVYSDPIPFASRLNLTCHIAQALLAGFSIFASVMINKTYNLIKEHRSLGEMIKAEQKHLMDTESCMAMQRCSLLRNVTALTEQMKKLEFNSRVETKRVEVANARALALKNHFDELHLKYDELLEYNQTIQNQLQCINPELQNNKHSDEIRCNMLFDNEAEATNWCRQYLFPDSHSLPSPRHRRSVEGS